MRGFLKTRSAGNQLLVAISITLVSFFILGLAGHYLVGVISGKTAAEMSDVEKWDLTTSSSIMALRGLQIVQFVALFLLPPLATAWLFSTDTKKYLHLQAPSHQGFWIAGILLMIFAIPLSNWLGELNRNINFPSDMASWMKEAEDSTAKVVKAMLSRHTIQDLLINLVVIAGLAAVGEELLFRGVVQRLLTRMFKSPWAAIIVSAAFFSALHMQFYGFFPRLLLGILLGAIFWYSNSLWVAIAAHFVYDAVLVIAAYYKPELLDANQSIELNSLALAGSISFVLVVIFFEWMRRKSTATYNSVYGEEDAAADKPFQRR